MENGTLAPEEKLKLLQRLDGFHSWQSTRERRLCLGCGKLISGSEIKFKRGLNGFGLIDLECPTEGCSAGPMDWISPAGR
jgi:hypothetical protein